MKNFKVLLSFPLLVLLYSCIDMSEHNETPSTQSPIVVTVDTKGVPTSATGVVVTDNPTQTLSFQEAKSLKSGTILKLRLNRTDSEVREYYVKLDGIYDMDGEHLLFCSTNNELVVGQGDSGSPLLTSDGKVVGALCYGFSYSNNQFAARAIDDMTSIKATPQTAKTMSGKSNLYKELGLVQYAFGVDKETLNRYKFPTGFDDNVQFFNVLPPSLKESTLTQAAVIPGNSIAVGIVRGDLFTMGAIGTLSYISTNNDLLAFGHPFGLNPISARTTTANMVAMINSTYMASKMAVPTNQVIGCMISDTSTGILIDGQAIPAEFDQQVTLNLSGALAEKFGNTLNINHVISNLKNPVDEVNYAAEIAALGVFSKIIQPGNNSLQATCTLNVTFAKSPALITEFRVESVNGFDVNLYFQLISTINDHFGLVAHDNITEFKISLNLSEYSPNIIE